MKKIFRHILLLTLLFALGTSVEAQTRTQTTQKREMTAQEKKRAADKAKRDKERQKQQAERQKQQQKAQAERLKQQQKAQTEKEKQQAERDKQQAEKERQQQKQAADAARQQERDAIEKQKQQAKQEKADYEKYDKPVKQSDAIHYFNLSGRLGYAAMFDNIGSYGKTYADPGTYPLMDKSLTGGAGAGLQLSYELAYHAFRFETGIGFDWLNSRSDYSFGIDRRLTTYPQTYHYITDDLREVRNLGFVSIPVMFGAQFSRYYFMLGARVGYGIFGKYGQHGRYDVTVNDDEYLKPYGMGIINNPAPANNGKLILRQPDVRLAAEFGIDLDEWLQAEPDKRRRQVKPGERYPFGKEHIHYKVALFADYGILNSNAMSGRLPLAFAADKWQPTEGNTVLAIGEGSTLNNLFVGAKFIVQFEVPSKRPPVQPVRPSYIDLQVVDEATGKPVPATVVFTNLKSNKASAPREMRNGTAHRSASKGDWKVEVTAKDYFDIADNVTIEDAGQIANVILRMRHVPYFRLRITDADNGTPLPANAQILRRGNKAADYTLTTDSVTGSARIILPDTTKYALHIDLMGYDSYDADIASVGDSMNVMMRPVKKGEVFIMKNLFFATNKTRILKASEDALNEMAGFLNRNPEVRVKIIGHTDNVGTDAANQKLSDGRANAVRDDLIERGIDPTRLEAEGRGEGQPIDTNDTEEGRQNNRRVEIEIL